MTDDLVGQLRLKTEPFPWQCPYCRRDVGYLGKWLAKIFGTRFHGCDFSNVRGPHAD